MNKDELREYIEKYCNNCKNRNESFCEIREKIDNKLNCTYYEEREKGDE